MRLFSMHFKQAILALHEIQPTSFMFCRCYLEHKNTEGSSPSTYFSGLGVFKFGGVTSPLFFRFRSLLHFQQSKIERNYDERNVVSNIV